MDIFYTGIKWLEKIKRKDKVITFTVHTKEMA